MEIGIDMTYIPRFKEHERLAKKIFGIQEYEYYLKATNKEEFVASRFAIKEAFLKCLKKGILDLDLKTVVVCKEDSGAIHVEYLNKTYKASLSHENEYCVGVVIYD